MKDLMRKFNRRSFLGHHIIDNHFEGLKFEPQVASTIEISTRFHYHPVTGFYLSQHTIEI